MTLFGGSRVNTRSTRYELCSISVSHRHCLRDFKPTKCKKPVHIQPTVLVKAPTSLSSAVLLDVNRMSGYILFNIKQLVHHTNSIQPAILVVLQKLHKTLHTKWYKMFSLDVPKYFQEMYKIYDIYFPLFFSILLPSRYAP